jgi:hypothetical protein
MVGWALCEPSERKSALNIRGNCPIGVVGGTFAARSIAVAAEKVVCPMAILHSTQAAGAPNPENPADEAKKRKGLPTLAKRTGKRDRDATLRTHSDPLERDEKRQRGASKAKHDPGTCLFGARLLFLRDHRPDHSGPGG